MKNQNYKDYISTLSTLTADLEHFIENKIPENANISEVEHVLDFLISEKAPKRLLKATFEQMKNRAEKWSLSLQKKASRIVEDESDIQVVLDFGDGFKFVKLIGKNAFKREGFLMKHCVSSYFGKETEIFSLRDKNNNPHCTIEKDKQIKGKVNGDISPKYIDYVVKFLEFSGMEVRDSEMKCLGYEKVAYLNYVKDSSKLYRGKYIKKGTQVEYQDNVLVFTNLQEACSYNVEKVALFKGNAIFSKNRNIVSLGNLKEISDNADFENSQVQDLGKLERIGGSADFRKSQVQSLGNLKSIGGSADFRFSQIKDLGNLKIIGAAADFENSRIKDLGKLERIGGYAIFSSSPVQSLGNLESIGGSAYFRNSQVQDLGNLKSIGGYADFRNSQVQDLGNLKIIEGYADFENSQVQDLGKLERIGGSADFRNSQVQDLGNLKIIEGYADFENSPIKSLTPEQRKIIKGSIQGLEL